MSAAEEVVRDQDAASLRHVEFLGKLARQVRGDDEQAAVDAHDRFEERRLEERAARRRLRDGEEPF